jgi:hypothetical protein
MANQFTKAEAEGKEKPKAENQFTKGSRTEHDQATRDKIRAEVAAGFLERALKNKKADLGTKVAAAKALLPYGKSTYASVQETISEKPVDEAETVAKLANLLAANPALLKPLLDLDPGLRASLKSVLDGVPTVVNTLPRTATSPNNPENDSQHAVNT